MSSGELKPCPFCGSPGEIERDSDHHGSWFNLGCSRHWGNGDDDKCPAGRLWYTDTGSEDDAVAAWNRRTPEPVQEMHELDAPACLKPGACASPACIVENTCLFPHVDGSAAVGEMASTPSACRRCSVCEGQDHHWIYVGDVDEGGEPVMSCKHCDATRAVEDDDE